MGNVEQISFASADELARAVASAWLDEIESANRAGKTHCVALSGGRIAQKFFTATVAQAEARAVSFARVHFSGRMSAAFRRPTRKAISSWRTSCCLRR